MTQKSRKIRAIAAGGAVLGVGAAITLAAWSDSEFASGLFTSDDFGIQAATDGANYGENATEGDALQLTFDGADALYPGQTVAQAYQIRNIAEGADSRVTLLPEDIAGDLGPALSATVLQVDGIDCTPETTGTELAENGNFDLLGQAPEYLCMQVTLDGTYEETDSQNGTITWQFEAENLADAGDAGDAPTT